MCKRLALVISAISGLASLGAQADVPVAFHLSGQGVYTQVKASGETFSPTLFQLKADMEFTDGLLDGIGLQGMVAAPMSDDNVNELTLEITQQSGIYLTLTNPDTQPEDLKVSILLGYASTEIETYLPALGESGRNKDTFSDFSYGISLQDQVIEGKPFYWTLDYLRYYNDDNLRVDGLGLGVTYAF
ncbi:MAG TPA: outer membrane beta-barrel protein [Cellvibrio sp.]